MLSCKVHDQVRDVSIIRQRLVSIHIFCFAVGVENDLRHTFDQSNFFFQEAGTFTILWRVARRILGDIDLDDSHQVFLITCLIRKLGELGRHFDRVLAVRVIDEGHGRFVSQVLIVTWPKPFDCRSLFEQRWHIQLPLRLDLVPAFVELLNWRLVGVRIQQGGLTGG